MTDLFDKAMQESFDEEWSIFRLGSGYQVLVWDHLDEYLAFVDVRVLVGKKGRPRQRVAADQTLER